MLNMQKEIHLNVFNEKLKEINQKLKGKGVIVFNLVSYSNDESKTDYRVELHLYYPDGRFWEYIYRSGNSDSLGRKLKLTADWLDALIEKFDEYVK